MALRLIAFLLMVASVILVWNYNYIFPPSDEPMIGEDFIPGPAIIYSVLPEYPSPPGYLDWKNLEADARIESAKSRVLPQLKTSLAESHLSLGRPVYLRIFKETLELEIWIQALSGEWVRFRNHKVAGMSGQLGPKTREGDLQAPEGFYQVTKNSLNPRSSYHLSFNIGYPNTFDRLQKYTGSLIMVHGKDVSVGCFAMTDRVMEEIYLLVEAALLANQQDVPVHVFPFRMSEMRMLDANESPWYDFWVELRKGYDLFETTGKLPNVTLRNGRYHCTVPPSS